MLSEKEVPEGRGNCKNCCIAEKSLFPWVKYDAYFSFVQHFKYGRVCKVMGPQDLLPTT